VEAGIDNAVATPAITAALYARFVSRQDDSPTMKAIAAMRNQFGGHAVKAAKEVAADPTAHAQGQTAG
jgi:6-phosphogluconate dehydrogenase